MEASVIDSTFSMETSSGGGDQKYFSLYIMNEDFWILMDYKHTIKLEYQSLMFIFYFCTFSCKYQHKFTSCLFILRLKALV